MTELLIKIFIKDKDNASRHSYGVMAGIVGICCNLILTAFKIVTGLVTGAVSIASDAVNNLSDAVSSIATLIGFRISGKPADREHPYGHGRVEYVTGFIIAAAVIAVAINLLKESLHNIFYPKELDVSYTTIIILSGSILLKLWMSIFYTKISKKISSKAMMATAIDSRSDCITTGVALISVIIMLFFGKNVDGYAGAIVSLFVIYSGIESAKETIAPIIGEAPDKEIIESIENIAKEHPEILGIHDIRLHEYGPGMIVSSFHVEMPYTLSLVEAHEVVDDIERRITEEKIVTEVTIHIDPVITDDEEMLRLREELSQYMKKLDERISIHDFRMIHGNGKERFIFDIAVPYELNKTDDEVKRIINEKLGETYTDYLMTVTVDRF